NPSRRPGGARYRRCSRHWPRHRARAGRAGRKACRQLCQPRRRRGGGRRRYPGDRRHRGRGARRWSARAGGDAMMGTVTAQLGPIDVLVNNAGIALRRGIDDLSEADFDRTIAVNLKSAFLCTQAVVGGMRERGWGRIVNISSGAARGAGVIGAHYNASKAGMEGLTRGYAARLASAGVTVNRVAPSPIQTDMTPIPPADAAKRIPVGRMGLAEEVAQAVVMVVANPYMTGQTVQVNGGLHFN